MAAFGDVKVGDRLTLRKRAGEMPAGSTVEVVRMLGPQDSTADFPLKNQDDGVAVRLVREGALVGGEFEFVWACGKSYFAPKETGG